MNGGPEAKSAHRLLDVVFLVVVAGVRIIRFRCLDPCCMGKITFYKSRGCGAMPIISHTQLVQRFGAGRAEHLCRVSAGTRRSAGGMAAMPPAPLPRTGAAASSMRLTDSAPPAPPASWLRLHQAPDPFVVPQDSPMRGPAKRLIRQGDPSFSRGLGLQRQGNAPDLNVGTARHPVAAICVQE